MSSDFALPAVGPPASSPLASRSHVPAPDEPEAVPGPSSAFPNPTLRLDPSLEMVVIEFRDETGQVRSSIPTQAQLDAYRSWERSQVGVPPQGARSEDRSTRATPEMAAGPTQAAPAVPASGSHATRPIDVAPAVGTFAGPPTTVGSAGPPGVAGPTVKPSATSTI